MMLTFRYVCKWCYTEVTNHNEHVTKTEISHMRKICFKIS